MFSKKKFNVTGHKKIIVLYIMLFALFFLLFEVSNSFNLIKNFSSLYNNGFIVTEKSISISDKSTTTEKNNSFSYLYYSAGTDCFKSKLYLGGKDLLSNQKSLYLATDDDLEQDLTDNIEDQLNDIDFSKLDSVVDNLDESQKTLFGSNTFLGLVKAFIYGEDINLYNNFFSFLVSNIFKDILSLLPYFATIVAIAIIYSLLGQFSQNSKVSTKNVVHIVCFTSIALIVVKIILILLSSTTSVINSISAQMEVIFPILLTLITSIGGTVTATTFQPVLATLSAVITKIFVTILIPIFIFSVVFNIVGNISNNVKLEKFSKFFSSFFNWSVGIIFTIFIAFLSIQGLTVSGIDGISIKTAKYAIKSYIPILGSYLSDGVGLILTSSSLIKNSVGVTGLVLLISTVLGPILNIIIAMLLFKLVSALLEPLSDSKISNFLFSISKSLNLLNTCLIAIGFMYLISTSMLMIVSNIF